MTTTKIEWTEQTWNPTTGCTKVSPGCKHCYAEAMAERLRAMGVRGYENGFKLSILPERLNEPLRRRKPTMYFVNSMSDLFHVLEDLGNVNLAGIHWAIVGGESGPKARPMKLEWVEAIQKQCVEQDVAFFFKQWGGWGADGKRRAKKANGRELAGRTWDEMPLNVAAAG